VIDDTPSHLYVVSDLHLGGDDPSNQVFCADDDAALEWLVFRCSDSAREGRTTLCLAGDIVDFLIDAQRSYFDVDHAVRTINHVAKQQCPRFFAALQAFTEQHFATLVVLLGNHDLEFVDARVQTAWEKQAGPTRWEREEYRATIDGHSIRVVHGNETDSYNRLPPSVKAEFASPQPPASPPNAGTKLVVDLLNPIKKQYSFADLLKPETGAVPLALLCLPTLIPKHELLRRYSSVAMMLGRESATFGLRQLLRWFAAAPDEATRSSARRTLSALDRSEQRDVDQSRDDIRAHAQYALTYDVPIEAMVDDGNLGLGAYLWAKAGGRGDDEAMRIGLDSYAKDTATFDVEPTVVSAEDRAIMSLASGNEILVAGHTHLARSLKTPTNGHYFNTGTWMRLAKIEGFMLTAEHFATFKHGISTNDVRELDVLRTYGSKKQSIAYRRRTYVHVGADNGTFEAALREVETKDRSFESKMVACASKEMK
jgi:UDP-2,3-diacylglucosamine pyrophosphatase LpxH